MLCAVTDRDLRDEIEQLSAELRVARKQLDYSQSVSGGAEQLRVLTTRLAAAKAQYASLRQQIPATEALLKDRKAEISLLKDELADARKQIASLDPLPSPFDVEPPNWAPEGSTPPGCLQLLVLCFAALGLSSAAWWLA